MTKIYWQPIGEEPEDDPRQIDEIDFRELPNGNWVMVLIMGTKEIVWDLGSKPDNI